MEQTPEKDTRKPGNSRPGSIHNQDLCKSLLSSWIPVSPPSYTTPANFPTFTPIAHLPLLHSICTNSLVPQMWHVLSHAFILCRCYSPPRMTFILFLPDQPKFTFFQMNAIKIYGIPTMLPFLQVLLELFCGSYCQSY